MSWGVWQWREREQRVKINFEGKYYEPVCDLPISRRLERRGDCFGRRGRVCGGVWVREREGVDGQAAAFYYQAR